MTDEPDVELSPVAGAHVYDTAPLAVNVVEPPGQTDVGVAVIINGEL